MATYQNLRYCTFSHFYWFLAYWNKVQPHSNASSMWILLKSSQSVEKLRRFLKYIFVTFFLIFYSVSQNSLHTQIDGTISGRKTSSVTKVQKDVRCKVAFFALFSLCILSGLVVPMSAYVCAFLSFVIAAPYAQGANFVGFATVDAHNCSVWTKADFITYYASVETGGGGAPRQPFVMDLWWCQLVTCMQMPTNNTPS